MCAFAAVGVILICVTFLGQSLLRGPELRGDETDYITFAHNLVHGTYAVSGQSRGVGLYLWHGPGLPLMLTPLVVLHAPVQALRLVGPLSLLLAGVFFWRFLKRYVVPELALVGGVVLALFPPFLPMMPRLFSEPVALMFLMAAALALAKAHESSRYSWALLSGLMAGLMVLTRVEGGWILLVALVMFLVQALIARRRRSLLNLACVVMAVGVCAPWLAYTSSLSHKFPYWSSSGGQSLYWMATPTRGTTGSWVSPQQIATDPHFAADRPLFKRLSGLPQVQADSEIQQVAIRLIRRHPAVYGEHLGENLARMIIGVPYSFERARRGVLLYGIANVLLLLALGTALIVSKRTGAPRRPQLIRILAAFGLLNLMLHIVVAAQPRMTTLSVPAALALVMIAADHRLGAKRREAVAVSAVPAQ